MIDTFVFDWSGVISHDAPPVYEANMMLLQDHGQDRICYDEWRRRSALNAAGFLRNCGVNCDDQETYERYKGYFNSLVANGMSPEIIPGALGVLEELSRRGELVLLSSHPEQNLRDEMTRYGVDDFFGLVVGSAKDKIIGLRDIHARLGLNGNSLYTGDTIHDIQAAKAAGFLSGAVSSQYAYHTRDRLEAENPDFLMDDITGLLRI